MKHFVLFVDTETTGLPKNWSSPISDDRAWPSAVQVAWVIFDSSGNKVKEENHYISNADVAVSSGALKIHGLTSDFLKVNGIDRKQVLQHLKRDLDHYDPLVVGHFVELDLHVLGADFHRTSIEADLFNYPVYCTMLGSDTFVRKPWVRYLSLKDLHEHLFGHAKEDLHNALTDAHITASVFFEMKARGLLTTDLMQKQQQLINEQRASAIKTRYIRGNGLPLLLLLILLLITLYLIFF